MTRGANLPAAGVLDYKSQGRLLLGGQHTELLALGVGEHHMTLRALTDVDAPGAESGRLGHRLLLVLEGRASQIEVQLILTDLLLLGPQESDRDPVSSLGSSATSSGLLSTSPQLRAPARERTSRRGSFAAKLSACSRAGIALTTSHRAVHGRGGSGPGVHEASNAKRRDPPRNAYGL